MAQLTTLAVLLTIVTFGMEASEATTVFKDPSAFAVAAAKPQAIGFNGILLPGQPSYKPLVSSQVKFLTQSPGTNVNVTTAAYYYPQIYPADFIVLSETSERNNALIISLPRPYFAIALDYGGLGFWGASSATITLSNGYVFSVEHLPTVGNTKFAGFVSSEPFTSLTLACKNDAWVVQDVILAEPISQTPSF